MGTLNSIRLCYPDTPLYFRELQFFLIAQLHQAVDNYDAGVSLPPSVLSELRRWISFLQVPPSTSLVQQEPTLVVTTDASGSGYGATLEDRELSGSWSQEQQLESMNYLELLAIYIAAQEWSDLLSGRVVLFRSDITTAIAYIFHISGTRSRRLCDLALRIWQIFLDNAITPWVKFVPGVANVEADLLSRNQASSVSWVRKHVVR
jgi:hypothetical protein